MYCIAFLPCCVWWPDMAINGCVQYNGGSLPDIIMLTQGYLMADGPHRYHPACGHKGSSHLSPVHALHFFIGCKFSTLTTRHPMVEFYLLTFPRFPLRKKEHKSYFGKNRTHDFRSSRCADYLLHHSGDEGCHWGTYSNAIKRLCFYPMNQQFYTRSKKSLRTCRKT